MAELVQFLKKVSLFRGLTPSQLERVAELIGTEAYQSRDVIISQDTPGSKMYLVSSGQVEIVVNDANGRLHSALILGTGQIFGEIALLDQGNRSATVHALEDGTTLYTLEEPEFTALCKADTGIGYIMMRNLALDLSVKIRHKNFSY
ncbi:MAG: cyclic nucleotide-binding domain-containing protein [Anaerolineae bacterium]|nr:cyclic nucleotide-binding domain-containing protein [Anaerolineae bacterium]